MVNLNYRTSTSGFVSVLSVCGSSFVLTQNKTLLCKHHSYTRSGRTVPGGSVVRMSKWIENVAEVQIQAPAEEVFLTYSDLEAMPKWSPWLRSVEVDPSDETISKWSLAARGISVSWKARNTEVRSPDIIAWESIDGLPNRGKVLFSPIKENHTKVQLSVAFQVPSFLASIMENDFVSTFVQKTLLSDLERFRTILLREYRRKRMKNSE
uniref:Coenzyme Q-binding protein COQ10 START domain-containing protein n=1 Tax=Timspurckia oligopyrenoides TaxID=708627 RepID=A0A7S1EQM7_9RHOD|mmetsp:Transcript_1296/g.2387  ORF Transcript_1296/g.2387 Transcript_1296/m.2387 type:complete len:209 (+) Transcript_1296:67-693(+)